VIINLILVLKSYKKK